MGKSAADRPSTARLRPQLGKGQEGAENGARQRTTQAAGDAASRFAAEERGTRVSDESGENIANRTSHANLTGQERADARSWRWRSGVQRGGMRRRKLPLCHPLLDRAALWPRPGRRPHPHWGECRPIRVRRAAGPGLYHWRGCHLPRAATIPNPGKGSGCWLTSSPTPCSSSAERPRPASPKPRPGSITLPFRPMPQGNEHGHRHEEAQDRPDHHPPAGCVAARPAAHATLLAGAYPAAVDLLPGNYSDLARKLAAKVTSKPSGSGPTFQLDTTILLNLGGARKGAAQAQPLRSISSQPASLLIGRFIAAEGEEQTCRAPSRRLSSFGLRG
jgi:hypothetical protein